MSWSMPQHILATFSISPIQCGGGLGMQDGMWRGSSRSGVLSIQHGVQVCLHGLSAGFNNQKPNKSAIHSPQGLGCPCPNLCQLFAYSNHWMEKKKCNNRWCQMREPLPTSMLPWSRCLQGQASALHVAHWPLHCSPVGRGWQYSKIITVAETW
jgi:hypothetical protein